jgi:uncharacterized protein DUF2510
MYDFESVSVSSFEAASLAATLTERSADGWEVVAIVPAGSDVVAYLRRSSQRDTEADGGEASITDGTSNTLEVAAAADLLTPTSVSSEPSVAEATGAGADTAGAETAAAETGGTGWAAGTETPAATSTGSGWSDTTTSESTSSWSGSAQQAPTSTPSVPAGWYADPAGRFELRYWDGTAWTEHVSRGGQQFTDAPVA